MAVFGFFYMILISHVAVGSAVGLATGNPVLAFFAGWLSHHLCDNVPHVDSGSDGVTVETIFENKNALAFIYLDVFLTIIVLLIMLLRTNYSLSVLWGGFGGLFPDIVDNSPFWIAQTRKFPFFKQLHYIHEKFHFTVKSKKFRYIGWMTQAIVVAGSFAYVFTR